MRCHIGDLYNSLGIVYAAALLNGQYSHQSQYNSHRPSQAMAAVAPMVKVAEAVGDILVVSPVDIQLLQYSTVM